MTSLSTLADLGELRLIEDVIGPIARRYERDSLIGDDCAYVPVDSRLLAVTADVGPKPLIHALPGHERDFEAAGWHAVVATASDVATAGARPLFLANCIDAPPDTSVEDFSRYVDGYFHACASLGFRNAGGDVRHGPDLAIRVFGAGAVDHGRAIGRSGLSDGDRIVLIGPAGDFMATYLLARDSHPKVIAAGDLTPHAATTLRFPMPRLREMRILATKGLITAASDTSDGLIGAVDNLVRRSKCGIELQLHAGLLPDIVKLAAESSRLSPWNIFSCWGDWSVVAAVPEDQFEKFAATCKTSAIGWLPLGRAVESQGLHATLEGSERCRVIPVRNENFISRGFNAGVSGHLRYMLETNLFDSP